MVNTFLPYDSFEESAKILDNKRLYKQVVECKPLRLNCSLTEKSLMFASQTKLGEWS